jgi:Cyclin, N-terminal domain
MIDWMIEVLTNFKCDDQTFFLSVSLIDRYFKLKPEIREVSDLHIIGVTCMFIASKYEDIYPLKMKMVYEKIAHKKLPVEKIKTLEMDILKTIKYRIPAPTSLDFLKYYLKQVLNIGRSGKSGAPGSQSGSSSSGRDKKSDEALALTVIQPSS